MVTNNLYNLGLFNGDIGIIRENEEGKRVAYFQKADGDLIEVWPGYLQSIETVFAMTIHKSQGSEYNEAYIVLPQDAAAKGMSAELLYTAITRAKKTVIIQASEEVIIQAVGHRIERSSGIVERLS
jgi:exodeoxyribonuclease V alpha subunit